MHVCTKYAQMLVCISMDISPSFMRKYVYTYLHMCVRAYVHKDTFILYVKSINVYVWYHRRRSEVIRLFLSVGWAHRQKISYHIKPGIAGNIIDIGQIPGFVS